jgi:hypothetical protein
MFYMNTDSERCATLFIGAKVSVKALANELQNEFLEA